MVLHLGCLKERPYFSRRPVVQEIYLWHIFVWPGAEILLNSVKIWWVKSTKMLHTRAVTVESWQPEKVKACARNIVNAVLQKPNLLLFWYSGSLNAVAHSRCAFQAAPVLKVCLAWPNMGVFIPSRDVFICSHQKMYIYGGKLGRSMPAHRLWVCRVKRYCQAAYVLNM